MSAPLTNGVTMRMHEEDRTCPFLNHDDARCANRFSLQRMDQAFAYCLGQYFGCPVFARLVREDGGPPRPRPEIHLTIEGHEVPAPRRQRHHVG